MFRVVVVEFWEGLFGFPGDYVGPFDAVFGLAGDGCECAERDGGAGGVHVELTFEAGCDCG